MGGKNQPDFGDIAAAQGEENDRSVRNQIYANRPDQYTPWGYTTWDQGVTIDPATGQETTKWYQTQGLTPELQEILNKQIAIQGGRTDVAGMLTGRMGSEFGTPMDWRGLNPMGQVPTNQFSIPEPDIGNPNEYRGRAEQAMYNQGMSRLNPLFEGKRNALETKLRNQGIGPEDEAWQTQMTQLGQQETDAHNQNIWSAVGEGRNESDSMWDQMMGQQQNRFQQSFNANQANFGQAMQSSNYSNAIRQQQLTEAMQKRGFSLNEINALLSGQQVNSPQMPNFTNGQAAQPAPLYQAGVDQSNFDQGQQQQYIDAAVGAGGMLMMSDRRLKTNIKHVGSVNGHPWYTFEMLGHPSQGVMADEVPESYTIDLGGYKAVNYDMVFGD